MAVLSQVFKNNLPLLLEIGRSMSVNREYRCKSGTIPVAVSFINPI